jgi:ABC-2 type transport system ATP-binding protein
VNAVVATELTQRYRRVVALDGVDVTVPAGTITGLLGRNGAGKTTLLQLVAGHLRPTEGTIDVLGGAPFENPPVLTRVCLIRESQRYSRTFRIEHVVRGAASLFPRWDHDLAERLLASFELPRRRRMGDLSRGMRSAVGCLVGLASRAELTCFDEPTAGLDAVARQTFYDALIAEVAEQPRTVVLSTHLIDEVAPLVEHTIVLHRGQKLLDDDTEALRRLMLTVTGPAEAVDRYLHGRREIHREQLGTTARVTLSAGARQIDADEARRLGLEVAHPTLQEVVVQATNRADPAAASDDDAELVDVHGGIEGGARS